MNVTRALIIVAHPDDETLWAGGEILSRPSWRWTVASVCRGSDPDRAPKFRRVVERLGASGFIGDLDDGPDQAALPAEDVESAVLDLLPGREWDVVYTHSPFGEYTRHRRHEEVSRAVTALWERDDLITSEMRLFAYEDGGREYLPLAIEEAHLAVSLDEKIWQRKRDLIEKTYGFSPDSWEVRATPHVEAFWQFKRPAEYLAWKDACEDNFPGGRS